MKILYKLQNHISPLTIMCQSSFMGSCAYLVYFIYVAIFRERHYHDHSRFLWWRYLYAQASLSTATIFKGWETFRFQKRLLSGVKSSQNFNFRVRQSIQSTLTCLIIVQQILLTFGIFLPTHFFNPHKWKKCLCKALLGPTRLFGR